MSTTVTTKGQVTIPKSVRDYLGIHPGSKVDFRQTDDGQIVLVSAEIKATSRFAQLRGRAGVGMATEDILALARGEA